MPHLSVMLKPASSACNMRCKYCFYHSLAESRESYGYGKMTENTAEEIIKKTLSFANGDSVYYSFQGGEPLLAGREFFDFFIKTVKRYNVKNSRIFYNIQTNGTLVDRTWNEFFRNNEILIGLSLDGDRPANANRLNAEFGETFERVLDTADWFLNDGVEFNILIVATPETARRAEDIYCFLRDRGYKYHQYIPVLRPTGSEGIIDKNYLDNESMFLLLDRLFNLYVRDYVRGNYVSIRLFDNWVRLYRREKNEQCGTAGYCTHQLVFEGDGSAYPCDFYCLDEYRLGYIADSTVEELLKKNRAESFIKESLPVLDRCKKCAYFRVCRGGGCKRSRADFDYCEAYRKFFEKNIGAFRVFLR